MARTTKKPQATSPPPNNPLWLVRSINTVETEAFLTSKAFMPLDQIVKYRSFPKAYRNITLTDSTSGKFENSKVSLVIAGDGQHFKISVVPSQGCGTAFFSDDSYLIYQGQVIGCDDNSGQKR